MTAAHVEKEAKGKGDNKVTLARFRELAGEAGMAADFFARFGKGRRDA